MDHSFIWAANGSLPVSYTHLILDLVGAEEFKALCEELNDMAPALRALKDQSYLQRNTYLFTIDDGYGLTHALKLMAKMLKELSLISDADPSEIRLPNTDDVDELAKLEDNMRREMRKLEGCVVCLDLSPVSYTHLVSYCLRSALGAAT